MGQIKRRYGGRDGRTVGEARKQYALAVENYDRISKDYTVKMQGLVSFSIADPPREPQEREWNHIIKFALMGLFISLAAGVGAIAGSEFLDQSFTDVESARDFLRLPSLGIIPMIESQRDRRRRLLTYLIVFGGIGLLILLVVLSVLLRFPEGLYGLEMKAWHYVNLLAEWISRRLH